MFTVYVRFWMVFLDTNIKHSQRIEWYATSPLTTICLSGVMEFLSEHFEVVMFARCVKYTLSAIECWNKEADKHLLTYMSLWSFCYDVFAVLWVTCPDVCNLIGIFLENILDDLFKFADNEWWVYLYFLRLFYFNTVTQFLMSKILR